MAAVVVADVAVVLVVVVQPGHNFIQYLVRCGAAMLHSLSETMHSRL